MSPLAQARVDVPFFRRIVVRLSLAITAILVVLGAGVLIADERLIEARELHELELRSGILGRGVLSRLATGMVREQHIMTNGLLGLVSDQAGVLGARVVAADGTVSFSSKPEEVGEHYDWNAPGCPRCHESEPPTETVHLSEQGRFLRTVGVRNEPACERCHGDEHDLLGVVVLELSTERMESELSAHRTMAGAVVGSTLLVSVLAVFFMMSWSVRRPLRHLLDATGRVEAGDLAVRVEEPPHNELGLLRSAFNSMVGQLERHTQHLESEVDSRTQEARALDRSLREAQSQLLRINRLATMGEMAAAVAHEVRTPLNALALNLHLMRKRLGEDAGAREELDALDGEVRRIDGVIQRFLTMARFPVARSSDLDLNATVKTVLGLMEPEARRSGVELRRELVEPAPIVHFDGDRLRQVLLNLVMNALQAMPDGGTVTVATRATKPQIEVRDTGPGVPAEAQSDIFKPFFTTKEEGTGLGLAICARLLREVGAEIRYLDGHDGAVFALDLPVEDDA